MDAQNIINNCNSTKLNPRQFRDEMNISWLINDTINEFNKIKSQSPEDDWIDQQNELNSLIGKKIRVKIQ